MKVLITGGAGFKCLDWYYNDRASTITDARVVNLMGNKKINDLWEVINDEYKSELEGMEITDRLFIVAGKE